MLVDSQTAGGREPHLPRQVPAVQGPHPGGGAGGPDRCLLPQADQRGRGGEAGRGQAVVLVGDG